jgi:hypothetical protein
MSNILIAQDYVNNLDSYFGELSAITPLDRVLSWYLTKNHSKQTGKPKY